MMFLSENNQSNFSEAFNSTSRYLDYLLNIENNFFDSMVNRINPSELQLNKAIVSDTEVSFLDLHLCISDGFVMTKFYDIRDDFDIVNFPFLDGDFPRSTSYGVYTLKKNKNATLFQRKMHWVVFKVLDRDNETSSFQFMLNNATKHCLI